MEALKTEFEDSIFRYDQIERNAHFAIYTQTHKSSGVIRYEVVKIHIAKAHMWPNGGMI